ncbi:MAG: hypothetical protein KatS3mg088_545 [Patescibacteria group bacterium]|nr:MAG: hypothetical protein KatS3mg088_545 [Patescibacteria group bacterium]
MESPTAEKRISWYLKGPRGTGDYEAPNVLELKKKAFKDPLTNLNNREGLREIFGKYLEIYKRNIQNASLRVFLIDLDGFKRVNDRLGHKVGDSLLESLAGRWQKSLRQEDVLARIGGDEFVVLAFTGEEVPILERLREGFSEAVRMLNLPGDLEVGFSIGSARIGEGLNESGEKIEFDINNTDAKVLLESALRLADKNMYNDKSSKKDERQ